MMEILSSYESLQDTHQLQHRLESAKDPIEIIHALSHALQHIQNNAAEALQLEVTARLEEIQATVAAYHKRVIIPQNYASWGTRAQSELAEEIERHEGDLQKLRTTRCATKSQRRLILDESFGVSIYEINTTEQRRQAENDPQAFASWKQKMEGMLQKLIDEKKRLGEFLIAKEPKLTTTE